MGTTDEVIVPVLAPADVLAGIAWQGLEPVFADLDLETMSLTPRTVEDQVTVHTRGVYVTPLFGVVGNWEALRTVTEPRGIQLQVEGTGGVGRWERIAPGVRGMASSLIEVDPQLIHGFEEALADLGLEAKRIPEWRGRKRDFPGMSRIESQVLLVDGWREMLGEIQCAASMSARQLSFDFGELRRPPARADRARLQTRRAV